MRAPQASAERAGRSRRRAAPWPAPRHRARPCRALAELRARRMPGIADVDQRPVAAGASTVDGRSGRRSSHPLACSETGRGKCDRAAKAPAPPPSSRRGRRARQASDNRAATRKRPPSGCRCPDAGRSEAPRPSCSRAHRSAARSRRIDAGRSASRARPIGDAQRPQSAASGDLGPGSTHQIEACDPRFANQHCVRRRRVAAGRPRASNGCRTGARHAEAGRGMASRRQHLARRMREPRRPPPRARSAPIARRRRARVAANQRRADRPVLEPLEQPHSGPSRASSSAAAKPAAARSRISMPSRIAFTSWTAGRAKR